jgi:hypothetical protein
MSKEKALYFLARNKKMVQDWLFFSRSNREPNQVTENSCQFISPQNQKKLAQLSSIEGLLNYLQETFLERNAQYLQSVAASYVKKVELFSNPKGGLIWPPAFLLSEATATILQEYVLYLKEFHETPNDSVAALLSLWEQQSESYSFDGDLKFIKAITLKLLNP